MQNAADVGNEGGDEGDDQPKTVAEAVGDQAKLLLLTRFRTLLVVYVISIIRTDCSSNLL